MIMYHIHRSVHNNSTFITVLLSLEVIDVRHPLWVVNEGVTIALNLVDLVLAVHLVVTDWIKSVPLTEDVLHPSVDLRVIDTFLVAALELSHVSGRHVEVATRQVALERVSHLPAGDLAKVGCVANAQAATVVSDVDLATLLNRSVRVVTATVIVVSVSREDVVKVGVGVLVCAFASPPALGPRVLSIVAVSFFLVVTTLLGLVLPASERVDVMDCTWRAGAPMAISLVEGNPQAIIRHLMNICRHQMRQLGLQAKSSSSVPVKSSPSHSLGRQIRAEKCQFHCSSFLCTEEG